METLITDRTEQDVVQRTAKGYYNYTDLNRVESAVEELSARLNDAGYLVNARIKTNWTSADIPTQADMERYRQNVVEIRAAFDVLASTPPTPQSMRFLNWAKANDIEKILMDVDDALSRLPFGFRYSGEIFCGEG